MHNEAKRRAANLLGLRPEYCRLDAELRRQLIHDITNALFDAARVSSIELQFFRKIEDDVWAGKVRGAK